MNGLVKTPLWLQSQVIRGYCFIWDDIVLDWDTMENKEALSAEHSGSISIIRCHYCSKPAKQKDIYFPYEYKYNMCLDHMIKYSGKDSSDA